MIADDPLMAALSVFVIAVVGLFGLAIGSFLNVVVWRVPRGESVLPPSQCPRCDAAIRPWQNVPVISWLLLRGKCANCGEPISARYPLVELTTGLAFAAIAWWWLRSSELAGLIADTLPATVAAWITLAAYLWFAGAGIALTIIDVEHFRLPDAIVLPSVAVVTSLLAVAALLRADWGQLVAVLGGAAVLFGVYFLIVLVYPGGMGGGDIKLAPMIGAALGFIGWSAIAVGAFFGFLLGALYGLGMIALRRGTRKTGIPFGPFMLAGAWLGILFGPAIMDAYLGLFGL